MIRKSNNHLEAELGVYPRFIPHQRNPNMIKCQKHLYPLKQKVIRRKWKRKMPGPILLEGTEHLNHLHHKCRKNKKMGKRVKVVLYIKPRPQQTEVEIDN